MFEMFAFESLNHVLLTLVFQCRFESDTMGEIQVPADRYWGAQTQRSLENFKIGTERMPDSIIRSLGIVKHASSTVNERLGKLDKVKF